MLLSFDFPDKMDDGLLHGISLAAFQLVARNNEKPFRDGLVAMLTSSGSSRLVFLLRWTLRISEGRCPTHIDTYTNPDWRWVGRLAILVYSIDLGAPVDQEPHYCLVAA